MLALDCTADGNPAPTITWTRLSNGNIVNMPLTVTGEEYEGAYRCTASNRIGTVFKDTSVTLSRMYLYLFVRNVSRNKRNKYTLEWMTNLRIRHIRQIHHIRHLQRGPSCLVICIDLLVAGEVGEFDTFAKFTTSAKVTTFVKFAIFALTCWLPAKLAKMSKFPTRLCLALFLTTWPYSLLRAFWR